MLRDLITGVICAALGFLLIAGSNVIGLNLQDVMFGLAAGAVLGLVRTNGPGQRVASFLIGFVIAMISFLLRVALFPSTWVGYAVATVIVIGLVTIICGLTRDRLPMWAAFLGVVVIVGSYTQYYIATPWLIQTQIITTASGVLVAVGAGYLLAIVAEIRRTKSEEKAEAKAEEKEALSAAQDGVPTLEPEPVGVGSGQIPGARPAGDSGLSVLSQNTKEQ